MITIKELRKEKGLTQVQVSEMTNIPIRTYKDYENNEARVGTIKYNYIMEELMKYGYVDEEHGKISIEEIKAACIDVFAEYNVEFAILFGSYATGRASEMSDVNILIASAERGMRYYGIEEKLKSYMHKNVDIMYSDQLHGTPELLNEILKYGVRIYC